MDLWLPLTQDTRQQGLSNASVTAVGSGATINANGKLGKCYYLDGTSNGYITTDFPTNFGTNDFTISLWVKIPTISSGTYYTIVSSKQSPAISVGVGIYWHYGSKKFLWSTADGTNATEIWMADAVDTIIYDKWIHLVMVRDNNDSKKGCFYINGTRYELASVPTIRNITTATNLWVGKISSGNYPLKMYISDIRVWNGKALSPKEIEILSRGLVAHYPLSNNGNGQANLLKNSNFTEGSSGSQGYNFSATWAKQTDCMKITSGSASSGLYTANYDNVTTGDMATFSAYVKADASMTIYIGVDGSGIGNCESFTIGTSWQRISISKAKTTNNANLRVYGSGTFYVRHMKYELGTTVTPWCPNSADSIYSSMGYDSTTEYDVSGYNYHGTRVNTFNWDSNTARYSVSTKFNGSDNAIQIPFNQMLGLAATGKADYTINVWTYKTSIGTKGYQTILGGTSGFELEARNASGTDPQYVAWNWGKPIGTYEFNKWCMFTFVHTSSDCKIYVNGEYASTGSSANVPIGNFYIGSWNTYNSQNYEGQMSDFRIYATALSDAQVAELYNTAVSVANNGTLLGYELVEV